MIVFLSGGNKLLLRAGNLLHLICYDEIIYVCQIQTQLNISFVIF